MTRVKSIHYGQVLYTYMVLLKLPVNIISLHHLKRLWSEDAETGLVFVSLWNGFCGDGRVFFRKAISRDR